MLLEATRWRRLLGGQRGGNGPEGGARQSSYFKRISREAAVQGKVKLVRSSFDRNPYLGLQIQSMFYCPMK